MSASSSRRRENRPAGRPLPADGSVVVRAIAALEASLDPLFAAGRYRDFFDRVHGIRETFRDARLPHDAREQLWQRLNRLADAAKARQAAEFAARRAANLARWRGQLDRAEAYAAALHAEIGELAARRGPSAELARWQRRIAEKQARLLSVEATVLELRRRLTDEQRQDAKGKGRM